MQIILGRRHVFNCSARLILLYGLAMVLFISLGNWQWGRADQKRQLLKQQQNQAHTLLTLDSTTQDDAHLHRYKQVQVRGHYDRLHPILLDNQILNGKAGYFVFTPFILADGNKAVLVNRGWLPTNPNRAVLPQVSLRQSPAAVTGRVNTFPSVGLKLPNADVPTATQPPVVQVMNAARWTKQLGYPLFSFQIELAENQPEGYTRHWAASTLMLPEQHVAYALQWLGLAFTASGLFFWYSIKRIND